MYSIENIPDQGQSSMDMACEHAQTFGLTPEPDEFDSRDVWDEDDAIDAVHAAFELLADGIGPDGTQLADERESLLWGFVNMLDAFVTISAQNCDGLDLRRCLSLCYLCFLARLVSHAYPCPASDFFPGVEYRVELLG